MTCVADIAKFGVVLQFASSHVTHMTSCSQLNMPPTPLYPCAALSLLSSVPWCRLIIPPLQVALWLDLATGVLGMAVRPHIALAGSFDAPMRIRLRVVAHVACACWPTLFVAVVGSLEKIHTPNFINKATRKV